MEEKWRNPTALFFATLPEMKELCFVTLVISQDVLHKNKETSVHQLQVIKCRELIFTEQNIMATPSLDDTTKIFVTMHMGAWKSKALLPKFQKMGLQVEKASRLFPHIFQSCFVYTLTAKLAPGWNKVANLFVHGRDFLTSSDKLNAVKMNMNVTNEEVTFALEASSIKLPANQIQDFEICAPVLERFYMSKSAVINEYSIESKWCHVLPSMKKGKLVKITHDIPQSSPFKSYKDIRRHWKNTYGYRLPELEDGEVFFNIYFPGIGHTLFTYPEFCVRKRDLIVIPRADPDPILETFVNDIQSKMPQVCGMRFCMSRRAKYSKPSLCEASSEDTDLNSVMLTDKPPIRKLPARRHIEKIYSKAPGCQSKPTTHPTISHQASNLFRNAGFLTANCQQSSQETDSNAVVETPSAEDASTTQQKIIPIFKAQCVRTPKVPSKTLPVFKQMKRPIPAHQTRPIESKISDVSSSVAATLTSSVGQTKLSPPDSFRQTYAHQFASTTSKMPALVAVHGSTMGSNFLGDGVRHIPQETTTGKRKKQDVGGDDVAKRPKSKPKIQENVDIGLLAVNGQLSKVNTATLSNWLRERHIAVKAKDKKGELIDKVMQQLQIKRTEE
ncbi:uncharacterized protein C18orf63-like [Ptychodera flava]|uniref:uncharacterized protein C18orf63-like n=1 Tax=Ptychodera flava TaxID=63121 RepID=UPI00396A6577